MPRSARWPPHAPPADDVDVDVGHALHRVRAGIHDQPVPALGNAGLLRHTGRRPQQPPDDPVVLLGQVVGRGDVLVRDDQEVGRGLRLDVAEGGYVVVPVDDVSEDRPRDDSAEDAVVHVISPQKPSLASRSRLTVVICPSCRPPRAKTRR